MNNQIASTTKLLNSFRISCERERREIQSLRNEKTTLEALIIEFKNNNEDYLKIKQAAEENARTVLINSKILLRFATASVIEPLRRNPELCNFVLNDISNNNICGFNCDSLTLPGEQQQQSFSCLNDDIYTALILEEAEKIYNTLTTRLRNEVMVGVSDEDIITVTTIII